MKKGFFEEEEGVKSWTRLASTILLGGWLITQVVIFANVFDEGFVFDLNTMLFVLILDALWLTAIFAPKVLAKTDEVRRLIEVLGSKSQSGK